MTDKPPEPNDAEADRRFSETLGRLANTPHKPHAPLKAKAGKRTSPKDSHDR